MTPVAGVPKREPCQKCGNPVFLAERLTIGKFLYHRKCLRCARCESQLTPGSFYETEVDGVFCCETCPDEENKLPALRDKEEVDKAAVMDARKSFREKLAMFQTDGKGLLQKSLSDEEKSKSLKRLTELYTQKEQEVSEPSSSLGPSDHNGPAPNDLLANESDSESTTSDSEEDIPPLPTSQPPSEDIGITNDDPKIDQIQSHVTEPPAVSVCTESHSPLVETSQNNLSLEDTQQPVDISESKIVDTPATSEPLVFAPNTVDTTIRADNIHLNINNMPSDALNNLTNVTKEDKREEEDIVLRRVKPAAEPNEIANRSTSNVVRNRLTQFEALLGSETKRQNSLRSKPIGNSIGRSPSSTDDAVKQQVCPKQSEVDPNISILDEIEVKHVPMGDDDATNSSTHVNVPTFDQLTVKINNSDLVDVLDVSESDEVNNENKLSYHKNERSEENVIDDDLANAATTNAEPATIINPKSDSWTQESADDLTTSLISDDGRPVPLKRSTKTVPLGEEMAESLPPTPLKRRNRVPNDEGAMCQNDTEQVVNEIPSAVPRIEIREEPVEPDKIDIREEPEGDIGANASKSAGETESAKYPDTLNPFGSDDEDEGDDLSSISVVQVRSKQDTPSKSKGKDTSNPFDSSDDEIELLKDTPKKKISKNGDLAKFR